jgi:invasion protein IalB
MNRIMLLAGVGSVALLVGCASTDTAWIHSTNNDSSFYADEAECQRQKQQVAIQIQQMEQAQRQQAQSQAQGPYGNLGASMGTLIGSGIKAAFGGPSKAEKAYRNCMRSKGYRMKEGS